MTRDNTWHLGRPHSIVNRVYDHLRRAVNRRLVTFLGRHLPQESPGPRTLEAGCGTALASSIFRERYGASALCIDHDARPLLLARARDPQLLIVVADACRLPLRDDAIDLVFSSSALEHLPDPQAALQEMHRVCRDRGSVFVGVPYRFGPLWFQPWIASTAMGQWLGPVFSYARLARLCAATGLQPVAHLRYFFRFFVGIVAAKTTPKVPGT